MYMKSYVCLVRNSISLAVLVFLSFAFSGAQVPVTTYHNDNYRSGANTNETTLTPANVNVQSFGKLAVFPVQGYVYTQPLYVPGVVIGGTAHNVLYIATEHDQVYAFDVNSGQQLWHTSYVGYFSFGSVLPVASFQVQCADLVPEIGITGTPVIDTTTNTMYLVTKEHVFNSQTKTSQFAQTLHALDITTGLDKATQPISASVPGTGDGSVGGVLSFNALIQNQRAALLLDNGEVFVSWSAHCDNFDFHGWIMSFDKTSLAPTGVYVSTADGEDGGFWASGSGPAVDSSGGIYFASGNGDFTGNSGGIDFGDSILRLSWSNNTISLVDYFTPWDQETLDENDTDVGSGGVLLLPDQPGAPYPHLLVQAGKEGTIDLVNRDNMGHFHSGNDDQIVQTLPFEIGGEWGSPAFWNNNIYFGGAFGDYLTAFAYNPQTQLLSTAPTSNSPEEFWFPGPTASVSSNGTTNGIVWIIETDMYGGGNAVLRAYDATNLANEFYNSNQNLARDQAPLAVKFSVPTVADGQVFVAGEGQVAMYGLLSPKHPSSATATSKASSSK